MDVRGLLNMCTTSVCSTGSRNLYGRKETTKIEALFSAKCAKRQYISMWDLKAGSAGIEINHVQQFSIYLGLFY